MVCIINVNKKDGEFMIIVDNSHVSGGIFEEFMLRLIL